MTDSAAPKHILVVDDEDAVLDSIRALLEAHGYSTAGSMNGRAALEEVEHHRPDLILTDLYMPECDGFELIEAMRSVAPEIPIIAMSDSQSSKGSADYLGFARKLGAAAAITKPFVSERPFEIIEDVLSDLATPPLAPRT